ncbi:alpha/beta hydrolase family protein [Undibacterium curvum]|uniref:Prolyl oligopeptidase family serine peptidase n=1 Tax=Undibacterium curvum TaxID=2762294 RepID=A0ABR7A968_9BURK|nr:prolyl oligopeptidase family serine peptidase [Undibacterium curvum]MBC3933358.1 prolyl oligopeptidase family serine peptidase [Undibacterium curvum]
MIKLLSLKHMIMFVCLISGGLCFSPSYAAHETPPSRQDIFESRFAGRPAVNQTGDLVAVAGLKGATVISLLDLASANYDQVLDIDGISQLYWYRWSNRDSHVLVISCKRNQRDVMIEFDTLNKKIHPLSATDEEQTGSFSTYKNNYAFTYDRFWNKSQNLLSEISADGTRIPVPDRRNLFQADRQQDGFIHVAFQAGQIVWTFGMEQGRQTQLKINAMDQRQGSGLISIASGKSAAYFLSSVDADTLGLIEVNLKNGGRKILAQEGADIKKVILHPDTAVPDIIEYENFEPMVKVLDKAVADDIAFLSAQGLGPPGIVDRSPKDLFWIVKYEFGNGIPVFYVYDRRNKIIKSIVTGQATTIGTNEIAHETAKETAKRMQGFSIARAGEPALSGYVALPRAGLCQSEKCPAVLLLHGGPGERDFAAYDRERYWLTSRGMIVINVNYRGSRGFGKQFEALDKLQWDSGIPKDVMDALHYVLANYPVDPGRIALIGTSFSGYLSFNLMARSNQFKCAIVDSASADLVRFSEARYATYGEHSDLLSRIGDPRLPEERARLFKMSPVSKLDKLKDAKLLQFHGGSDAVVGMDINADFSPALLKANPNYTFVYLPDASHGLPEARQAYHAISELFLADCLNIRAQNLDVKERNLLDGLMIYGRKLFLSTAY